ncbi:protein kinase C iota type-like [Centruroides vittatus]|uniref:protein kinase C iota type-like n=1 Tax=Centruroides vittatus TaxID=120091 RepID=UPI0035106F33
MKRSLESVRLRFSSEKMNKKSYDRSDGAEPDGQQNQNYWINNNCESDDFEFGFETSNNTKEKYEFQETGSGTFGTVYVGRCKNSDRAIAVKAIKKQRNLFNHEFDIVTEGIAWRRASAHPHVVSFIDSFETHIRGIRSNNILIDKNIKAHLIDFGLCTFERRPKEYCGTLFYLCPEILQQKEYDAYCEWWAFGVVLYQVFVGKTPMNIYLEEIMSIEHFQSLPIAEKVESKYQFRSR